MHDILPTSISMRCNESIFQLCVCNPPPLPTQQPAVWKKQKRSSQTTSQEKLKSMGDSSSSDEESVEQNNLHFEDAASSVGCESGQSANWATLSCVGCLKCLSARSCHWVFKVAYTCMGLPCMHACRISNLPYEQTPTCISVVFIICSCSSYNSLPLD